MANRPHSYGLRARIRPGVDLDQIVIKLDPLSNAPIMELRGRVVGSGDRRVDSASRCTVITGALPAAGIELIEQAKRMFGDANPKED